jgi:hypothetical protein
MESEFTQEPDCPDNMNNNKSHLYLDSCYWIGLSHIGHRLFMTLSWMWIV